MRKFLFIVVLLFVCNGLYAQENISTNTSSCVNYCEDKCIDSEINFVNKAMSNAIEKMDTLDKSIDELWQLMEATGTTNESSIKASKEHTAFNKSQKEWSAAVDLIKNINQFIDVKYRTCVNEILSESLSSFNSKFNGKLNEIVDKLSAFNQYISGQSQKRNTTNNRTGQDDNRILSKNNIRYIRNGSYGLDNVYTIENKSIKVGSSSAGDVVFNIDGNRIRVGSSSIGNVVFTIDGNRIKAGSSRTGDVVFTIDGNRIRAGSSRTGDVVFTIDGNRIKAGSSRTGSVIFTIDGNRIRTASSRVKNTIFTIDGNYIRAGSSKTGDVVFNIDGNLVRTGRSGVGDVIFNIDDKYIRTGSSKTGDIIFNIYTPTFFVD